MTGAEGEAIAAAFLLKQGYRILERNYRTPLGEIDMIAKDGETLVFIEVKARSVVQFGAPQSAVDLRKQAKMSRVALAYLSRKKIDSSDCRFDVIGVLKGPGGPQVELFQNAFDVTEFKGC